MAVVTVVIPTYNRPALLAYAIKSVLAQSFKDWKLLVIGDCCDHETAEVISSFADERIFYVNLESRCGEQSGPNSAGIIAANTEYVALLNHDDIWLSDHLQKGVSELRQSNADLCLGSAAFTTHARFEEVHRPAFNAVTPKQRKIEQVFDHMPALFEPASSWIFKRSLVDEVGPWKPAATLFRTPMEDWLLRVWRADMKLLYLNEVTVIYCNAEKRKWLKSAQDNNMNMYDMPADEQAYWWKHMLKKGCDGMREMIAWDLARINRTPKYFCRKSEVIKGEVLEALLTAGTARIYKKHGWDGFDAACQIGRRKPGHALSKMLERRTGQKLGAARSWDKVISFVEQKVSLNADWAQTHDG